MSVAWVAVGATVVSGAYSASNARKAGRENAANIEAMARRNNALQLGIAEHNANLLIEQSHTNALAIEDNAYRTAELLTFEYEEVFRRQIRDEKQLAGEIRAQFASSGFEVNRGTPYKFLHSELNEAETVREYDRDVAKLTITNVIEQGNREAQATREAGIGEAHAIQNIAALEAEIYLNEQLGAASSSISNGNAASNRILTSTAVSAIGGAANASASSASAG